MTELHDRVASVTERIRQRSHDRRRAYLDDIAAMEESPDSDRRQVGCSNMAHAAAAAGEDQENVLAASDRRAANIGIITAYNDMLSAHQPFESYPQVIRAAARGAGGIGPHYNASKAGMEGMTRGYAARLVKDGITVNAVAPSLIETDMVTAVASSAARIPLGRFGKPEECAKIVMMLLDNEYMTGQTVALSGGLSFL